LRLSFTSPICSNSNRISFATNISWRMRIYRDHVLSMCHVRSPNLVVIPPFFNRRTYPPSPSRCETARQLRAGLPNFRQIYSHFMPDKYRSPRGGGGEAAGSGFDIIALLRKPPRRVPAVLLICLAYPFPARERERFGSSRRENWISSLKPNLYGSLCVI